MSWECKKLGDIIEIKKGTYITKKESKEGPYPVILGGQEPAYYIDTFNHTGKAIVVSRSGASAGYVSFWNEPIFVTDGFLIEPKNNINVDFLYYLVKSHQAELQGKQGGAAIPHVNPRIINAIQVMVPNIEMQERIADILSAYDDLIENNQKQIKLLEEAAQRLYKEWFVDLRFPGYENTPITDGVPQGWSIVCLDDVICKIATGLNPRKNFVLGQGTNYYVTIKNMSNNNVFLDEKCDFVDDAAIQRINQRSDLKIGDLLFSGIGTIGRVYLIDIPTNNWNISESVFTMRANDRVSKEFLYLLLLSKDMQSYCDNNAHGAAQKGIRMADLRAYKFMLPCKYHLDEFTSKIKPIIDAAQVCRKKVKILTESRDRLLPKLMSGELEV